MSHFPQNAQGCLLICNISGNNHGYEVFLLQSYSPPYEYENFPDEEDALPYDREIIPESFYNKKE